MKIYSKELSVIQYKFRLELFESEKLSKKE